MPSKKKRKEGRPTKYTPKMCGKVEKYLEEEVDEVFEFHKTRGDKSDTYERKIKVQLPTRYGFAKHIGVCTKTIDNWAKEHDEFLQALEKIDAEQKQRLLDNGLSGDYNSVIAKLVLSSNHGMVEKQEIGGKDGEPIQITVSFK